MKIDELLNLRNLSKKDKTQLVMLIVASVILIVIVASNFGEKGKISRKAESKRVEETVSKEALSRKKKREKKEKSPEVQAMFKEAGRNDPFLKPDERDEPGVFVRVSLKLSGIVSDGERPFAVINDEIVGEGEMIGDKRILEIKDQSVVIQEGDRQYELTMGGFETEA